MKTLKILKQFFKQKASEIWTILTFQTDYTIPDVIRRWVISLVYGPIVITIIHMLGYVGPYIGLPINGMLTHYAAAFTVLCLIAATFAVTCLIYSFFFADLFSDFKRWITRNWRDAKRRVQDQEEKEKLK